MSEPEHTNSLVHETSPYLLQHSHNPVDWCPWGEEALRKAREEDKPILLSIGYSACHWCHVMEHESFEDGEIATLMNEHFVPIKVDREERPDLDAIYMDAVQAMTGAGGWPMTVFLTPDLRPFFGGSYFPPEDRFGRPGFKTLLKSIARYYRENRGQVEASASQLTEALRQTGRAFPSRELLTADLLEGAFLDLAGRFDTRDGGFGGAPKFPPRMAIGLLLRYWRRPGRDEARYMAEFTLAKMAGGGMYDQLGGGFHRYSVDAQWLVPHFEKMLYDNALLSRAYLEAFQATGKGLYGAVAAETLDYVLREMTSPEGGFYSSQDADSEGEEGKFYVWTPEEIREALGAEAGELFCRAYGVVEGGNFEHERSILHIPRPAGELLRETGLEKEQLFERLAEGRRVLFALRERRVPPGLDDKVITSWNGLMLGSMALGSRVLEDARYREAAERAAEFILGALEQEGQLLRTWRAGRSRFNAYLDDYAFLASGLLDLYEATFEPRWLESARRLARTMLAHYWDGRDGAFFFTSDDHEELLSRRKSAYDGAIPSGNSAAALSLLRLATLTGEGEFRNRGAEVLRVFRDHMAKVPAGFHQMLWALDYYLDTPLEVALVGYPGGEDTRAFIGAIWKRFLPNKVVAFKPDGPAGSDGELEALVPLLADKVAQEGKATAYLCRNYTCRAPTTDLLSFEEALDAAGPRSP
ncbi:MAG: thioredoxin domain-containing protein [Nitrospinota bacterium]